MAQKTKSEYGKTMELVLYEVKKIIVGQDHLVEIARERIGAQLEEALDL